MINSPLNYSGNKFKVVKEIIPLIPDDTERLIEVFAGSAIISINSKVKNIVLNDNSKITIELLKYFINNDVNKIIKEIDEIIQKYGFTDSYRNGIKSYPEKKHEGLSHYNREPFNKLKSNYNSNPSTKELFALNIFGFNHYLRFNSCGKFNVPVGKVDYTESLRKKTIEYCRAFKDKKIKLLNLDFRNKKIYNNASEKDLFYFDPPYLITNAPYNMSWTEKEERELLDILDNLNEKGIKFALSNVLESNGKENTMLKKWAEKYNVHRINRQYRNANYRRKNKSEAIEVLITNY